jgi:hypothetical protein
LISTYITSFDFLLRLRPTFDFLHDAHLQGLDELFAQSPAHRLLGPEHAAAIAAAERQALGFEQRAGRRDPQPDAASGGAEPATPQVHRHGGRRGEALPLPTARKLASLCLCVDCSHALGRRVCSW